MIRILWPTFFNPMPARDQIVLWRKILKANGYSHLDIEIETDEEFLPRVLVGLGLFPSANQVRKNRKNLFREVEPCERVKVGRLNILIRPL